MIRIPGSLNSKYAEGKSEVKIIQKWDGYRPPMNMLINSFRHLPRRTEGEGRQTKEKNRKKIWY